VRRSLADSLDRLGLDRVDICLVHDPDDHHEQALTEAVPVLAEWREQGRVGAMYNYAPAPDAVLARAQAIRAVCDRFDVPLRAAALQFPLAHPAIATAVVGAPDPG
jgi:aryl-alcohol dehydrogenase-like predicted oxidoreductase